MNPQAISWPLLAWIAQAVVYGSALALLTWALVAGPLRRSRPAVHGTLWLIVLLKFILPAGPTSPYSLSALMRGAAVQVAPQVAPAPADPLVPRSPDVLMIPLDRQAVPSAAGTSQAASLASGWLSLLALLYLAGVAGVAVWRVARYRRFAAAARELPLAGFAVRRMVLRACTRLGVRRVPVARLSDDAPAPYVFGVRRPTLVLSRRQLHDRAELEAVLLHEIAHLRRGDMLVRHLQWVAGTALFFWPVVAWVNRRIDLAREHACDEWALRHGRLSAGDYARCLLRAVQPVPSRGFVFQPTAMAANVSHIERRIDMILDHPVRAVMRRGVGLPGALLMAGWACFALAGAGAAIRAAGQDADAKPASETTRQIVVELNGDGAEEDVILLGGAFDCDAPLEGMHAFPPDGVAMSMWVTADDESGPEGAQRFMHVVMAPSPKMLADFAAGHPTADVDQDGKVARNEYDAYLVALAQTDVPAVLAQYPKADRNADTKLDAMETARLVQGGDMIERIREHRPGRMRVARLGAPPSDGAVAQSGTWVSAGAEGDAPQRVRIVKRRSAGARAEEEVTVTAGAGDAAAASDGEAFEIALHSPADLAQPVGKWLLENLTATPSGDAVAKFLPVVEEAPLVTFLELNPKADADGDGKLTPAERDAYIEDHSTRTRARFLKQHPESDTNADGVLSKDEMHAWVRANGPSLGGSLRGQRVIMKKIAGDDGQEDVTVEFHPASEPK